MAFSKGALESKMFENYCSRLSFVPTIPLHQDGAGWQTGVYQEQVGGRVIWKVHGKAESVLQSISQRRNAGSKP